MSSDTNYDRIVERLLKGRVIPFLGAGVNLCNRSLQGDWHPQAGVPPSGWELSKHLAAKFKYPGDLQSLDLLRISQFVEIDQTEGTLYDELHELFNFDFPPTPVHKFLASFPAMRRRGA